MVKTIHRFEVWWVNLEPTRFRNPKDAPMRDYLSDELAALKTVIVAPMTSRGFDFPSRISL